MSRTASLLAIALFGIVVSIVFEGDLSDRLDSLELEPDVQSAVEVQSGDLTAADPPSDVDEPTRRAIQKAIDTSFLSGFRTVMLIAAGMAIASSVAAFLLVEGKVVTRQDESTD